MWRQFKSSETDLKRLARLLNFDKAALNVFLAGLDVF